MSFFSLWSAWTFHVVAFSSSDPPFVRIHGWSVTKWDSKWMAGQTSLRLCQFFINELLNITKRSDARWFGWGLLIFDNKSAIDSSNPLWIYKSANFERTEFWMDSMWRNLLVKFKTILGVNVECWWWIKCVPLSR